MWLGSRDSLMSEEYVVRVSESTPVEMSPCRVFKWVHTVHVTTPGYLRSRDDFPKNVFSAKGVN
jgi:hypothetical protein